MKNSTNIYDLLSKNAEAKSFFISLPEDAQGALISHGSICSTAEMARCLSRFQNGAPQKRPRPF